MEWYEDERGLAQLFLSWKGSVVLGANIVRKFISLFFLLSISVVSCFSAVVDDTDYSSPQKLDHVLRWIGGGNTMKKRGNYEA